jgi:hypothetical protein
MTGQEMFVFQLVCLIVSVAFLVWWFWVTA